MKAAPKRAAFFRFLGLPAYTSWYAWIVYPDAYMPVARTTLNLDENLLCEGRLTGIEEKMRSSTLLFAN